MGRFKIGANRLKSQGLWISRECADFETAHAGSFMGTRKNIRQSFLPAPGKPDKLKKRVPGSQIEKDLRALHKSYFLKMMVLFFCSGSPGLVFLLVAGYWLLVARCREDKKRCFL